MLAAVKDSKSTVECSHKCDCPPSEKRSRSVAIQPPVEYKRSSKTSSAAPSPHHTEGKAFASNKPLVNEDEDGIIEQPSTYCVEYSLC